MKDTVTRLMLMIDELAYAKAELVRHEYETWHCGSEVDADVRGLKEQRQALQDELLRLFTPLNQCDGCMAGLPLRSGLHIDTDGKALMLCQKSKYGIGGES